MRRFQKDRQDFENELDGFASCFAFVFIFTIIFFFVLGNVFGIFVVSKPKIKEKTKTVTVEKPIYIFLPDTIVIPKGGSLCRTLKMSETEALALAKKFNYPVRYNDWGEPNVLVQPGEIFLKGWQPDIIRYLEPKK